MLIGIDGVGARAEGRGANGGGLMFEPAPHLYNTGSLSPLVPRQTVIVSWRIERPSHRSKHLQEVQLGYEDRECRSRGAKYVSKGGWGPTCGLPPSRPFRSAHFRPHARHL